MLPTEVTCPYCGRDATQAYFQHKNHCTACKANPKKHREPEPHNKNTCECGQYKACQSKRCVPCHWAAKRKAKQERLDSLDIDRARRDLRAFLQRIGFPGDSVPTN